MGIAQQTAGATLTAQIFNQAPVVVSYLTPATLSNVNTETVVGTFTIPAGDPTFPGGYQWFMIGTATAVSSPTITIRMHAPGGGTVVLSSSAITVSSSPSTFGIKGSMMFSGIGSSGTFYSDITLDHGFTGSSTLASGVSNSAVSLNTTISNTITVTAQFSVASASNTCQGVGGAMYRL